MSSYLNSTVRAVVRLLAICLCVGGCLAPLAGSAQPSVSFKTTDEGGHDIRNGSEQPDVNVNVTGTVVDAETGQPLPAFSVTPGNQDRERTGFDWTETNRMLFSHGDFKFILKKERLAPAVLIEADGYLPQCSGPIHALATNGTFRMRKGSGPNGVVLTPAGQPAAHQAVFYSRLKDLILLEGPKLSPTNLSSRVRQTLTDEAGRFSFAPDLDGFAIVVASDEGFAEKPVEDLRASSEIRLQPWASIEGTLMIGPAPGSNQTVRLASAFAPYAYYPRPLPPFSISVDATTDGAGRFSFPRVPPTDVKVFHVPKIGRGEVDVLPITQITNLTPKAGEICKLTIGGQGRRVVGRVAVKNYKNPVDWVDQVFWLDSLPPNEPGVPNFDAISKEYHRNRSAAKTQDEIIAVQNRYLEEHDRISRQLRAYYSTPASRQRWFSKRRYVLRFAEDGSFSIDDVPAGKYELSIELRDLDPKRGQLKSPTIAVLRRFVEVPESPDGHGGGPFDLGVIAMLAQLHPGDMAPDFAVKTLDDKTIKLSDYKGKFVLLDFWASWNAPSVAQTEDLKDTFNAFGTNPRFAMIGLSLDTNIDQVRAFSTQHQTPWTQGFLGKWSDSDVPDRFGLEYIPENMLINPDGRLVAPGLRGGSIKSTVDAALSPP